MVECLTTFIDLVEQYDYISVTALVKLYLERGLEIVRKITHFL